MTMCSACKKVEASDGVGAGVICDGCADFAAVMADRLSDGRHPGQRLWNYYYLRTLDSLGLKDAPTASPPPR